MIKLLDNSLPSFLFKGDSDVIKTRLICYADCYGFDKNFIDFWSGEGSVIARFDNTFTVWADKSADFNELYEFLVVIGAKDIITFSFVAEELGYSDFCVKQSFEYTGETESASITCNIDDVNIRDAYDLISESISDSFKNDDYSYLSFLSDFKYRQNRGFARGVCIKNEDSVLAVGFTAAETVDSAVLSGIACDKRYRKSGFGRAVIHSLASALKSEAKTVFVIALNDSAIGFYEHIGFERREKIAYIQ